MVFKILYFIRVNKKEKKKLERMLNNDFQKTSISDEK